jgi:hypothetical protein
MTDHEPLPEPLRTTRNNLLAKFVLDGWGNQSERGISRVSIAPDELEEMRTVFEEDIYDSGLADTSLLIGHFLVRIEVTEYPSEQAVIRAYRAHTESKR